MSVGTRLVEVWFAVTFITRALVRVPFGSALLALAGWIVWRWGVHWFVDLVAAWLAYNGCVVILGAFAPFAGAPLPNDPSTRGALRRSGMLGRR
jgi:hypothetical protein